MPQDISGAILLMVQRSGSQVNLKKYFLNLINGTYYYRIDTKERVQEFFSESLAAHRLRKKARSRRRIELGLNAGEKDLDIRNF